MIHTDGCPTIAHRSSDFGPYNVEVYVEGEFSHTHAQRQSLCNARRVVAVLNLGGTDARLTRACGGTIDSDVDTTKWMS